MLWANEIIWTDGEEVVRIIIIGKGPGWKDAPVEGETWGVNSLILRRPVKLAFQMHDLEADENKGSIKKQIDEVNRLGIPVVTGKKYKFLPTSIPFPIDEMPSKYFTNSIAYMVAYAIYKGATEIDLYGVPFFLRHEHLGERPCVEFWIGLAIAKGIKVNVHDPTTLDCCRPFQKLYGYDSMIDAREVL